MTNRHEIAEKVEKRLRKFQRPLRGTVLRVIENEIRREGECWYVPIRPDVEPSNITLYYDILAKAETELLEKDALSVLTIPTAAQPRRIRPAKIKPQPAQAR